MKTLDTTPTLFEPQDAKDTAAMMNETDDWFYKVIADPKGTGLSRIRVITEEGEVVGYM